MRVDCVRPVISWLAVVAIAAVSAAWASAGEHHPLGKPVAAERTTVEKVGGQMGALSRMSPAQREAVEAMTTLMSIVRGPEGAYRLHVQRMEQGSEEKPGRGQIEVIVTSEETSWNPEGVYRYLITAAESDPRGASYWVGIPCRPVDPALRAQLELPEGQGLLVSQDPAPDSPAARADIKQHDVLLKLDGRPLQDAGQLIEAVREARDRRELQLTLLRGGKQRVVKLKPAERPGIEVRILLKNPEVLKKLLKWKPEALTTMEYRAFRPGVFDDRVETRLSPLILDDLEVEKSRLFGEMLRDRKAEPEDRTGALEQKLQEVLQQLQELRKKVDSLDSQMDSQR